MRATVQRLQGKQRTSLRMASAPPNTQLIPRDPHTARYAERDVTAGREGALPRPGPKFLEGASRHRHQLRRVREGQDEAVVLRAEKRRHESKGARGGRISKQVTRPIKCGVGRVWVCVCVNAVGGEGGSGWLPCQRAVERMSTFYCGGAALCRLGGR